VDAAAGGWYWDEANDLLYVRTTGGGDPDTYTAYQAMVTFYAATMPVTLAAGANGTPIYYHPWLAGELPTSVQEVGDLVFGHKTLAGGTIALTNAHKFWNTVVASDSDYIWTNKTVKLLVGGNYNGLSLSYSEYAAIATMLVEDVAADEHVCTVTLKPLGRQTEIQLPVTPYFESSYPRLGEGVRGTHKALIWGRVQCPADLTDTDLYGTWTIADSAYQTLYAVHAVHAVSKTTGTRHGLTAGVHYTSDLTACTVTITDATYIWTEYAIEVEVTGKIGGTRGYLSTFSEITKDIIQTYLGADSAQVDNAAFTQAGIDAPEELAVYLKERRSLASILSTTEDGFASLEGSVLGTVQQTLSGLWTCWIWDPRYDASTIVNLRKEDFAMFRPMPKTETVYTAVRTFYNQHHHTLEWPVFSRTDLRRQYLTDSREQLDRYTYLRQPADAEALAHRVLFIASTQSTDVEFQERGAKLAQALAGDKVLVTFDPAPSVTGAYTARPLEVLRLEKGYSPQLTVVGRFGDLAALSLEYGEWSDASAPAWASASAAQKDSQGFWCDANGQPDAGDPTSADQSVWM
jgi:hypothetical protein